MTLGNIFGSAMSSTSSPYYSQHPGESHQILSERDGSGFGYGFSKKMKGKYKSDKKHAAMSALTLLAFLFFLNILQNCLREQTAPVSSEVTMMMMMPTPQKHVKEGSVNENGKDMEDPWGKNVRRTRSLLQVEETREESSTKPNRHIKFIHDLRDVKHNWVNGLSQLSEKELESQRLKTDNIQSYLKRYSLEGRRAPVVGKRFIKDEEKLNPVKEAETTTAESSYKQTNPPVKRIENDWVPKLSPVYKPMLKRQNITTGNKTRVFRKGLPRIRIANAESRNRRLDEANAAEKSEEEKSQGGSSEGLKGVQTATTSVGLDLNTYKTYPVYNYYRQAANRTVENATTPEPATETNLVASAPLSTTERHPVYVDRNPYRKYPQKHRFRYANHNRYYQAPYPVESRYRYSPYRKNSNYYESSPGYHVHEDYYPVAVVRNPQEDEVGFDLIKFVWTMLTGFARPLSKIVPTFAKVGNDEPQCYDLLVCEAHRVSRLMGPTAEALASTFSTLLTWYTAEENRQVLIEAVSSGKENTCQQQILNCDERSGGKSAMTVLAQVLETKLR